jgi:hypothetical protein
VGDEEGARVRLALISGDGLPVSGLLTVFRNVVELGTRIDLLEHPITADLGYSWRPDKAAFYPRGPVDQHYPKNWSVSTQTPADSASLGDDLLAIRKAVAVADATDKEALAELDDRINVIADSYEAYFTDWFEDADVDWVCATNMTLSDAVPVTLGLHRASARRWGNGRPGGVLFWDHDLYGSYAVRERGERVYPEIPHAVLPLPGSHPCHLWAVVSTDLAREAAGYRTGLPALVVPNVLPAIADGELTDPAREFLGRIGVAPDQPVILAPVRVFRVKGVEISVALLRAVRDVCAARGEPPPCLLVFGSMDEDPEYAAEVQDAVERNGVAEAVRFLGGVPLASHWDATGAWVPDEIDLLRISAASNGGVFFTPNCPDVESVGLGPALAALAGVPCAVSSFAALHAIYGRQHRCALMREASDLTAAAEDFVDLMTGRRDGDPRVLSALARNRTQVLDLFPERPWRDLLTQMSSMAAR